MFGLAALALAGCSSTPDAGPVKLDDLNLKPYLSEPCSLLDADQLSDLGIAKPGVDHPTTPSVGTCFLTPNETGRTVTLEVAIDWPKPKAAGQLRIAGYPAVEIDTGQTCKVQVSVANTQQLSGLATGPDACHMAENVATSAIGSIKRQNP